MVKYLRSANVGDGVILLDDVKEMNFRPLEQATFALRDGDVLVTEGSGSRETVGQSAVWHENVAGVVCFQNTLLRIRPRVGLADGRFLAWWARHAHAARLMAAVASGANILHLSAEELRRLPVPDLGLAQQRRIADFLDDQVARIDNIIAAREKQVSLVATTHRAERAALVRQGSPAPVRVRHLVSKIGSGETPTGGAEVYKDHGVKFLRSQNVHNDGLRLGDVAYIDRLVDAEMCSTRVSAGDVLLNITGASLGRCAVAPDDLGEANVNQHVCILRPLANIDPVVLAAGIRDDETQDQIRLMQVGGNRDGLNFDQVADLRTHYSAVESVAAATRVAIMAADTRYAGHRSDLLRSVVQLREFRQSLITAAVTGEFDVSSADGSRVPV